MANRCLFTFAAVCLMGLVLSTHASAGGLFVEPGVGIRRVLELGQSSERAVEFERFYGVDVRVVTQVGEPAERATSGIIVQVDANGLIRQIIIRDPMVLTKKFIRVSSPVGDVIIAYGEDYEVEERPDSRLLKYLGIGFEINRRTRTVTGILVKASPAAFAYYGIYRGEEKWTERFFRREMDRQAALPEEGDTIVATGNVNARAGYIEFRVGSGWTNKPVVGRIKPGDRLRVLEIKRVLRSYIWVKFRRLP